MKKILDLSSWEGAIEIDGTLYSTVSAIPSRLRFKNGSTIILHSPNETVKSGQEAASDSTIYKIVVKKYMTQKATPEFDFMAKFNNDEPMPMRTMVGTWDKETKGMYHMSLHCDILEEQTQYCMCCGKEITNPVSRYFGIGPVCGKHNYVNPFSSDEELKKAVEEYRTQLRNIQWEGWVIKSAIEQMEVI